MDIDDTYKIVYDKIIKRHQSSNRLHTCRLIFYIFDVSMLIGNIVMHSLNRAYVGLVLTICIHILSAFIMSKIYDHNENEIDDDNDEFAKNARWIVLRKISKCLAITPLFRIFVNWKDHSKTHERNRSRQKLRNPIDRKEIEDAVKIRKRLLVNAHFDSIHANFKTIPHCLSQIFMALDWNLPFKFCGLTDLIRFCTMVGSLFVAAKASASYTTEHSEYLKMLQIQDHIERRRVLEPITLPVTHFWWVSFLVNWIIVGSRVYAVSFILQSSEYVVVAPIMIVFVFVLNMGWIRINIESRPIYENPPRGILTIHSELVDRFMSIFSIHTVVPGYACMLIHQTIFGSVYIATHSGNVWLQSQSKPFQNWSKNSSKLDDEFLRCNFSTLWDSHNKLARALHLILNEYKDSILMFRAIFTNDLALIFLSVSLTVAIIYALYVKKYGLRKDVFPFGVSLKCWKGFLTRDWHVVGKIEAMKVLLLGTMDTFDLEICNYKLPNDLNGLKLFIVEVMEGKQGTEHFRLCKNCPCDNPCRNEVEILRDYLLDIEETDQLCKYFCEHFYFCMNQMSSYRIAQTKNIICDKNVISELFFRNLKYFGLTLNKIC